MTLLLGGAYKEEDEFFLGRSLSLEEFMGTEVYRRMSFFSGGVYEKRS